MSKSIDRAREDAGELDFSDVSVEGVLSSVMPGDILREEFMRPLGLSAGDLARDLGLHAPYVTEIIKGERAVSADIALRLAARFCVTAEFWMKQQMTHDLEVVRRRSEPKAVPKIDDLFGIAKGANPEGYRDRKDRY